MTATNGLGQFMDDFRDLHDMRRGMFDSLKVKQWHKDQNYKKILKECREKGVKFTDPLFPPNDRSLFFEKSPAPPGKQVQWTRASAISDHPVLFDEDIDPGDVNQGDIGNCWFVAGLSLMATKKGLLTRVVPEWNDFKNEDGRNYGIYRFRFWRLGEWIEVVVDDHLPTFNGRFLYVHSRDKGEYWSSLIEKAYAKISGSYESLVSGLTEDAICDFTGGVTEKYDLGPTGQLVHPDSERAFAGVDQGEGAKKNKSLFDVCLSAMHRPALLSASIDIEDETKREAKTDVGLILGHAYAVTGVCRLDHGDNIIRLRNPWGAKEWTGAWSDNSPEWSKATDKEKKMLFKNDDDGEFWMSWDDFSLQFTTISITRLVNTSRFSLSKRWFQEMIRGEWSNERRNTGGCLNNKDTFLNENHQYTFFLKSNQSIIFSLLQNDKRDAKALGADNFSIGFYIFPVEKNRRFRLAELPDALSSKSQFINTREVVKRVELTRGRYVVIPCTFKPQTEGQFLFRVYSETDIEMKQLTMSQPNSNCCIKLPHGQLRVLIIGVDGLPESKSRPIAHITFEGQQCSTFQCDDDAMKKKAADGTVAATFQEAFIFTAKRVDTEIVIKVTNKQLLSQEVLGEARVSAAKWIQKPGFAGTANLDVLHKKTGRVCQVAIEVLYTQGFPPRFAIARKLSEFERGLTRRKSRV
eukprot:c5170_g1_i2.p1 GENE.c5170_g1_i2~~c5170_g1_i2.p1  ORF type:complete len:692 (+),score=176.31 c5170_g1_i2:59-2134(+)